MNVPLEDARLDLSMELVLITSRMVGVQYGTEELADQLASARERALALDATEHHETLQAVADATGKLADCIRSLPDRRVPVPCRQEKDEYQWCAQATIAELSKLAEEAAAESETH
jgi:hypothetical protein